MGRWGMRSLARRHSLSTTEPGSARRSHGFFLLAVDFPFLRIEVPSLRNVVRCRSRDAWGSMRSPTPARCPARRQAEMPNAGDPSGAATWPAYARYSRPRRSLDAAGPRNGRNSAGGAKVHDRYPAQRRPRAPPISPNSPQLFRGHRSGGACGNWPAVLPGGRDAVRFGDNVGRTSRWSKPAEPAHAQLRGHGGWRRQRCSGTPCPGSAPPWRGPKGR
jgi:hypothetical protein